MESTSRKERFDRIVNFLEPYVGKLDVGNPKNNLIKTIPLPLYWFYQYFENHIDEIIVSNTLIPFDDLKYSNNQLMFYKSDFSYWAIENINDDKVIKVDENDNITYENNDLIDFLYQICIFDICKTLKYNMMFFGKHDVVDTIAQVWQSYKFYERQVTDEFPNNFFYKQDAIGYIWKGSKGSTFYCGSNHIQSLQFMKVFTDSLGLKNENNYTDLIERLEKGSWDFYINSEACDDRQFWKS